MHRKHAFHATFILCRVLRLIFHTSQPYVREGRQYVLARWTATISLLCLPIIKHLDIVATASSDALQRGHREVVGHQSRLKLSCARTNQCPLSYLSEAGTVATLIIHPVYDSYSRIEYTIATNHAILADMGVIT